jgi:hypothetical protein
MNAVAKIESKPQEMVAQATPAYLLQLAVQQGADLDKLEKLMALQERWEANEARKAFVNALTAFKSEPISITKAKHVEFTTRSGDTTSYNHAELSDVTDAICPALAKHGLSHRWSVTQGDGRITVECVLTHALGHSERIAMNAPPDASGGKNTIQQIASTVTYLQRYTLLAITGIATKGQDDDGHGADAEDDDYQDWRDAIEACAATEDLKVLKGEMVDAFKGATNVPRALTAAYNARMNELKATK